MTAEVLDLEVERLTQRAAEMDDETLVFVMLGLLQPSMSGHPVTAGASEVAGKLGRVAFMEIAQRWIPLDVAAAAYSEIMSQEVDDAS
jgi:hypothetical protein